MSVEITGTNGQSTCAHDPHVAPVVQKRDFIDSIVAATGARRTDARPIIEATLAQLGMLLSSGQTLAIPPLGRARINLERDARGADVITLRLRRRPINRAGDGENS